MKNIFILGSKGIPARYGGFETFVDQLTSRRSDPEIRYHVACLAEWNAETEHNGARCFHVKVPKIGAARAVLYDLLSLRRTIRYIRSNGLTDNAVYILACRIGPFLFWYKKKLRKLGASLYVNPDGQEWKRSKWKPWIQRYWKRSERLMIKHADRVVCDSKGIENYINREYAEYRPDTVYLSYGADLTPSKLGDNSEPIQEWFARHTIQEGGYYLMVGRFVPENNYELVLKQFMSSNTERTLVIVSNVTQNRFYEQLRDKTGFERDPRVKFVGTVYDQELLKKIRELAYGYIHGHEVGGTNPSLLEAMASTSMNLLLDVVFNKEVGGNGALYFNKYAGSLKLLLEEADRMEEDAILALQRNARRRIERHYDWQEIVEKYEGVFQQTDPYERKERSDHERNRAGRRKRDEALSLDEVRLEATSTDL
ncbi:beta 1-4 rhamnosyltransferase Cps2T [Cohnella faecalis]|uniref:Glycosyltransferase family 1 protein n=1 Tax=Cohnella faecalis TaxID=2315694 RepID=A0A398CMI6_9BACL|nr:DUF1972 domain-containing protein [Cohnella faecalis]RIE03823.1 glycosyltransferase family 1 protein [Cohnella faecalis]